MGGEGICKRKAKGRRERTKRAISSAREKATHEARPASRHTRLARAATGAKRLKPR